MTLKAAGFTAVKNIRNGMFGWVDSGMPVEADPTLVQMPPSQSQAEEDLLVRLGYDPSSGLPGPNAKANCSS
jgi:hypothetical protein